MSKKNPTKSRRQFKLRYQKLQKQLKKKIPFLKTKKLLPIFVAVLLLLTTGLTAFAFKGSLFSKQDYSIILVQPNPDKIPIIVQEELSLAATIQIPKSILSNSQNQDLTLSAVVNNNTLHQQELGSAHSDETKLLFTLKLEKLEDGQYTLDLTLKDSTNILAHTPLLFIKDTRPATLETSSSAETTTAKVSLTNPGENTSQTTSATIQTISITDTNPNPVELTLSFSELGHLTIDQPESSEISWTQEATTQPAISLPANHSPFTTTYQFTDQAGLVSQGQLNYSYDNTPPTITLQSPTQTTNQHNSYTVLFVVSEPFTSSFVTFNGQKIPGQVSPSGHNFATITPSVGENTFSITATDTAGNTTNTPFTITVTEPTTTKPSSSSPTDTCNDDDFDHCINQIGGIDQVVHCDKFYQYRDCLKSRCDRTVYSNHCE